MDFERSRRHVAEQDLSLEQTRRELAMREAHHNALKVIELEIELARAHSKARSLNHDIEHSNRTIEANKITINQYVQQARAMEEKLADWMVSQKAYKELSIMFGFDKGLTADEVIEMGNDKKMDVLDNKHNPDHGSNANAIPLLENNKEKIRERIKEKSKKK